jgi:hypothetical protein
MSGFLPRTSAAVGVLVCAAALSSPVVAAPQGSTSLTAGPNLGQMTVSPARARVGQVVTIKGVTASRTVLFLPPFVLMQSDAQKMVTRLPGPMCGGRHREPALRSVVGKGGNLGARGTKQNPPLKTAWSMHFRVPARMQTVNNKGKMSYAPTRSGKYYLDAVAMGIDYCVLPKKSTRIVSVGVLHVVK